MCQVLMILALMDNAFSLETRCVQSVAKCNEVIKMEVTEFFPEANYIGRCVEVDDLAKQDR
ncbi:MULTISPECIES: hypothetical protein [Mesorhizobium]|uniref:hypothetical protein n=1 Tax=Mesorhizobium TaxID=68287 RepID=UPI0007A93D4A|nr:MULTISPECIES: hypothetical protein [Mesorhizobium]AMX93715.1 hypothetical protein A4R28_11685 [Mesorhizobium ciceri]MDF3208414.1 hypothetical protein [Mesorhizobium sp. LMG15046]MDF3229015.1 hypothetical protein [Mesorhizobium sp. DSM 30133]RUU22131.1 hypothetical protein EOC84_03205 [Mesorhizobium sp. Primo-B]RUU37959.1 hypothetical protein EOC83_17010 [Mesorhizobium sp. Primo-A]